MSHGLEEVDDGKARCEEISSIQYLCASAAQIKGVIAVAPNIPLLINAGTRYRRVKVEGPVDDEAPKPLGNKIDMRPTEGIITHVEPTKNSHLTVQPIVQIEGGKTDTIKFGDRGGEGGDWCHRRTHAASDSTTRSHPSGDNKDDSDVGDWPGRQRSKHVRKHIAKIAHHPPNKIAALTEPIPASPEPLSQERHDVPNDDADGIL